jgi:TPP-dependent 2-oxoacid decarboxylase
VVGGKGTKVGTGQELRDALAAARRDNRNAHIIQADLDPIDVPRALKALGKDLAALMNAK